MSDSSKTYPRGLPYKPPETEGARTGEVAPPSAPPTPRPVDPREDMIAQQQMQLRRWIQILVFSTVGALAFIIGTAFFFLQHLKGQLQAARTQPAPNTRYETPPDRMVFADKKEPPVSPKVTQEPEKPETAHDRFMSALGNLTGIHLYQAYLNIGLLADCTEGEVYTTDEAQKWLERTVAQLEAVDKQLDALAKSDLDGEEKQGIEKCRQASALLRTQAMELREYWKNSDKDQATRYHKARDNAWASVSDVLQIPKE
jgi:hypothetical protein